MGIEELLWYDVLSALAETKACGLAPVPAARVRLEDEGLASREEVVGEGIETRAGGVADEDKARLASLAFLRQSLPSTAVQEDLLPFLFPPDGCGTGLVRVLSASLEEPAADTCSSTSPAKGQPKPRSLDDLFREDVDFRAPALPSGGADDDPLKRHELTSVLIVAESAGTALTFHALQGIDPC